MRSIPYSWDAKICLRQVFEATGIQDTSTSTSEKDSASSESESRYVMKAFWNFLVSFVSGSHDLATCIKP